MSEKQREKNSQISFRTTESARDSFHGLVKSRGKDIKQVLEEFVMAYVAGKTGSLVAAADRPGYIAVPERLVPAVSAFVSYLEGTGTPVAEAVNSRDEQILLDAIRNGDKGIRQMAQDIISMWEPRYRTREVPSEKATRKGSFNKRSA